MRMEYLRDLIAVAESRSITAASQKLFISQSSLSTMIKSLEEELGVSIFTRTAKGILPTRDGERLLSFARDVSARYDVLVNELSLSHTVTRDVSLVTYACASNFMSIHLTQRLLTTYPNAVLTVHEFPEARIIQSILNGVANIGVNFIPVQNVPNYSMLAEKNGLMMEELYMDRVDLYVGKDSPFAARKSVHVSELREEPMAISHCCTKNLQGSAAGRNISRITVLGNVSLVKQAVAQNSMIALLPRLALRNDPLLETGAICRVALEDVLFEQVNCLFYTKKKLSSLELAVLENIREFFRALDVTEARWQSGTQG